MFLSVIIFFLISVSGCDKKAFDDVPCGTYNDNQLWKESDGRCYFINQDGHKEYVEESDCNCS